MNELIKNLIHIMRHRDKLNSDAFTDLMSKILLPFPYVGWELGIHPADNNIDVLALSVRGDKNLVKEIEAEIKFPIVESGWQIVLGIPPRNWDLYFELKDNNGALMKVDAKEWYWKATWGKAGSDLKIYIKDKNVFQSNAIDQIIDIAVLGELGELNVAQYISTISYEPIIQVFPNMFSLRDLRKEFVSYFPGCQYADFFQSKY